MDRRLGNEDVPKQVQKLMLEESRKESRKEALRSEFCLLLEEELELQGIHHWGYSLQKKMQKYPEISRVVLKEWAKLNGFEINGNEIASIELHLFETGMLSSPQYKEIRLAKGVYGIFLRVLELNS